MKTKIHVNQHNIKSNKTKGNNLPVITVKQGRKNTYCNEVEILGPSKVVYAGTGTDTKPLLSCGARVIIETNAKVIIKQHESVQANIPANQDLGHQG